ncbi:MAG: substrate-binding domain-containing protein [Comamonadaceae bacterium]|nr:substrate-binding domain-containing protein [Comamonadaceae bacterium]
MHIESRTQERSDEAVQTGRRWPSRFAAVGRVRRRHAQALVKIDGSSTVFPITEAVAEEFQKAKKGAVKVTVGISGTGGGFKKFCRGETDISDASRPITEVRDGGLHEGRHQVHRAAGRLRRADRGGQPEEHARPAITVDELKKMWEPAAQGKVTNWNQVNPAWPDAPLKLFGAGRRLRHLRLLHRGGRSARPSPARGDFTASRGRQRAGAGRVAATSTRIGYFGYAYYAENKDKLKARADRRRKGGKPAVAPSDGDGAQRHLPAAVAPDLHLRQRQVGSRSPRSRSSSSST